MIPYSGIDIGSRSIKLAVIRDQVLVHREVVDATSRPLDTARMLVDRLPRDTPLVATGYGRDMLEMAVSIPTITEIKAHAMGARFLSPSCRTVIDIGGQDTKVISLDEKGRVQRFEMNDRCAAGTGRFLEIMAQRLGFSPQAFSAAALMGTGHLSISAICTVFAESEVVGLIHRGNHRNDIARALHRSAAQRIHTMICRVPLEKTVLLTGGGARSAALQVLLSELCGCYLEVQPHSQIAGAIGCALEAERNWMNGALPRH